MSVLAAPADGTAATSSQLRDPQSLTDGAQVQNVGSTPDGNKVVTVLVKDSVAESIAAYSAAGQVTIVQAPASAAKA